MKQQTGTKLVTENPPRRIKGTRESNEQAGTLWLVEQNDPRLRTDPPTETWQPIASRRREGYELQTEEAALRGALNLGMHAACGFWGTGCRFRIRNVITGKVKRVNVKLKVTLCAGRAIQEPVEFEHGRYYVIAARDRCMTHDDTGQCSTSCVQVPVWSFIDVPASRSASWIPSKLQIEFRGHQVAGYETMWGAVQAVEWLDRHKLQANILDAKTGRWIPYGVVIGHGKVLGGGTGKNGLTKKATAKPWLRTFCPDVWT